MAPRETLASGAPQARRYVEAVGCVGCVVVPQHSLTCSSRVPSVFLEIVDSRESVGTPALRAHLAWLLGRGVPLDLQALLASLENLASLGSQARLGLQGRQGDPESG